MSHDVPAVARSQKRRDEMGSDGTIARSRHSRAVAVLLMVAASLFLFASVGNASPAAPDVYKTVEQPDGSTLRLHLWGDEFANGWETDNGQTVVRTRSGEWQIAVRNAGGKLVASGFTPGERMLPVPLHLRPSAEAYDRARARFGLPPVGEQAALAPPAWAGSDTDVLFLAVEFSDRGCSFDPDEMADVMFGDAATGPGNLEDYFDEISYGALQVDGRVIGNNGNTDCLTLPETHAYYDTGSGSAWEVVQDAVEIADDYVDYDDYDNDGDGRVDQMGIIYAGGGPHDGCDTDDGPDGGDGDDLWPHFSGGNSTGTDDDADVQNYIINSELTRDTGGPPCDVRQSIGLFAHEMGHGLGLPTSTTPTEAPPASARGARWRAST